MSPGTMMPRCFLLMVLASLFGYSAGQCGDVEETLADFEVRKYSVVSAGGFPSGLNCTWLMQSSNSANKMLYQIKNVELDADDFLNVYAGSTSSDPNVVSDFTGHSASRSLFRVDSPNILTTFQSRQIASTDAQNFDLYFMSGADQSGPSCVDQTLTAGETPGILTSPSFPAKYPTSTTCSWTIEAPASATLELTFLLIDIEDGNSGCNYDGLVVFLPGQKANPVVSQCKRGVWEPEVYSVNNNVVQLEFTADDGDSYAGFVLSYKAILPTTTPAPTTAAPPTTPTPGGNTGSDPVACTLTQETGPCRGYFRKFTFDSVGDVCQEFIYGGCGGNENRFDTLLECEKHCPVGRATDACSQPEVAGSCMAYFKRYTYDAVSQTCKEFIYGGCGGNDNRFDTLAECQSRCQPSERGVPPVNPIDFNMETQVRDNICTLQQDSGPCRGLFRKFAYNSLTSGCQEFGYGGCGGNDNRFDTIGECESKCLIGNNEDACSLPIVTGPCRAILPRYAYDSVRNACSEFIYGGCSGNENRFETLQQCQNRCYPKEVPSAGGCDVVSCVVPIVVIVVLVIAATIVVLFLVRKRRSKSEKYRPTAVDEPEVEVDQNEMKTVPDDAVA